MKKLASRFVQNCLISLLSILFVLAVLEVGIRVYDLVKSKTPFLSTQPRNLLAEHPKALIPFRMWGFELYQEQNGTRFISSRWGELYPLDKPKGTFRIVCFGGSTTEQAIDGVHYPLRLQSLLTTRLKRDNIEVINIGNSAYATPHFLILLELDVIHWKPDLVILSENVNDLLSQYWPNLTFDYSNKYTHEFFATLDYASRYTLPNLIFQDSRLYWFLKSEWAKITVNIKRAPIRRRSYGDTPNPLAASIFEQNLRTFVGIAESHGIQVLLATQPFQPSEDYFVRHFAYKSYNDTIVYPLHDEFVRHHRFFNNIIRKVASSTGVLFLDNEQAMGQSKENFIDSVHYTKRGLEKLAESYAGFIIGHGLVTHAATVEH